MNSAAEFFEHTVVEVFDTVKQPVPTMYFFGVTTGHSVSCRMFPAWAVILGLENAQLIGIDLPVDAPVKEYRKALYQIKVDPLSLGALVTTHKLNLFRAAGDLFDELTSDAEICRQVSSTYKRDGRLIGHTVDPTTSGQAMQRFVSREHWSMHGADLLCLGAGGSAVALACYFCIRSAAGSRPTRMVVVDWNEKKLDDLADLVQQLPPSGIRFEFKQNRDPEINDRLILDLAPHSMVINATGMGKDYPGSPVTDRVVFPEYGLVWDLNYRGDLHFLHQAYGQATEQSLHVEDGWTFFLLGWSTIVGDVFNTQIDESTFERLVMAAEMARSE